VSLRRRAVLAFAAAFVLAIGGGTAARGTPTELFLSEYIEGTSNNKALEIFNGTGSAIDLAAQGYNVQMFFNGSATAGLTINLTGSVVTGDVYVLAHSLANAAILAQADQTNGAGWFNGDDAVVLRHGTTVIDVVGQVGFDPGTEWGSGLASTMDNTLRRKAGIEAGDADGSNPFDPSVEWDGFATDDSANLGTHSTARSTSRSTRTSPSPSASPSRCLRAGTRSSATPAARTLLSRAAGRRPTRSIRTPTSCRARSAR
jgi:predicted extracellular nuclease